MSNSDYSFGNWVKRRRKALDLTQQELAQRIGCSLSLIFKIESDERRPSRQIAELLAEHLEIPPDQRDLFLKVARQQKTVDHLEALQPLPELTTFGSVQDKPAPVSHPLQANLPNPPTSLIGREHELRAIIQQIQDPACRLLTLTGPGGVGKTRLALDVAHRMHDSFAHGACFVSLVGTPAAEFITLTIADSLGLVFSGANQLETQLFNFLKDRHLLLVLDNLDHLLDGVELLRGLLDYAPNVQLLTTSREQLNLRAEWTFEVQGLPVPSNIQLENLELNSAAALFLQRAKQVNMNFNPAPEDAPAIARICELVEGLPLGLELASAWVNVLSCQEITTEIERGLDFLATSKRDIPERHRSINAVFEYSWNLLSPEEQNVFKKLSVFQGGFQRDAAEKVAGATLPLLSSLLGKSLIRRSESSRYDQHELVRQYAAMRLREDAQCEIFTRDQYAAYYLALWRNRESQLKSAEQQNASRELIADIDNFRTAWDLAANQNHFTSLYQCLRSFLIVYDLSGWYTNAIKRLESLIRALTAMPDMQDQHADVFGLALSFQGWFYFRRGQLQDAYDRFERSLEILRPLDDSMALADVLTLSSPVMTSLGQADKAMQYANEGLTAARVSGDSWRIAHALMMRGGVLAGWGQYDQAYTSSLEALNRFRALGDTRLIVVTLNTLSFVALQSSRYAEAREFLLESLTLITSAEDPWSAGTAYGNLGIVELAQGNSAKAKDLLKKSIPLFAGLGMQGDVAYFMNYLGEAALRLGATHEAENHWLDAIRMAHKTQALPTALSLLVRLAELNANRGNIVDAYEWAIQVVNHPAAWQDSISRAEKLLSELKPKITAQQLETIQTLSRPGSLDHLIQEILARPMKRK